MHGNGAVWLLGGDIRKMTAQLMVWSGVALMDYGEMSGRGEKGERKACGGSRGNERKQTG